MADPDPRTDDRRSPWLVVLLVLALVAAIVLIIVAGHHGRTTATTRRASDTSSAPTSSAPTTEDTPSEESSSAPAEVQIDAADYVGRHVDEVAAELRAKGLEVDTQPVDNPGGEDADTVAAVRPTTGLVEGDTVTVEYYREAEPTSEPPTSEPTSSRRPRAHLAAAVRDRVRRPGHRRPVDVRPGRARVQIQRSSMSETPPEPPVTPTDAAHSDHRHPADPRRPPPGGGLVGGRYELGELLGRGGMAEVRKGHDTRLGRVVAIKRLRTDLASDATFQARFRREAQSAASLNHPAIVAVYDTGEEPASDGTGVSQPYIVMEFVAGRTLRDILREGRKILPERALEITSGVLSALDYSHRAGIIHRDIKPGNVMLTPSGDVKVMDFGIARAMSDSNTMTQTAAVVGTAQYLSPEQARGETVDSRSDVYSAGCLLYELLTGRPPFVGDSPVAVAYQHVREPARPPSDHDTDLPPAVDAIVMKALAKRLEDRYQSAAAMRSDIERYLAGRPVQAPVPLPPRPRPSLRPSDTSTSTHRCRSWTTSTRATTTTGRGGPRTSVLILLGAARPRADRRRLPPVQERPVRVRARAGAGPERDRHDRGRGARRHRRRRAQRGRRPTSRPDETARRRRGHRPGPQPRPVRRPRDLGPPRRSRRGCRRSTCRSSWGRPRTRRATGSAPPSSTSAVRERGVRRAAGSGPLDRPGGRAAGGRRAARRDGHDQQGSARRSRTWSG